MIRSGKKLSKVFTYPGIFSESANVLKVDSETFQIRYENNLSPIAKVIFKSFKHKHLYYAIDDILNSFKSNPNERDNLLGILYSPAISLQNNYSVDFFDIWISEIHIQKISKMNKFLKKNSSNFEQVNDIIIKFTYKIRMPFQKPDSLW